ncbi:MAG: cytidine deaminase [Clostridia bacterium]|nr:cytidine deaminase [Clostridia bacterium]MBR5632853.1 cytidine deaminase [Clostridia bacterium]
MTDNEKRELCLKAVNAMNSSYSPYSGFKVGAALLCDDGTVYLGCNIENSAYSPTVCAERVAVFKAVSDGKREFDAIAVAGGHGGIVNEAVTPCGVCRQVLAEFVDGGFTVLLVKSPDGDYEELTAEGLLPRSFSLK